MGQLKLHFLGTGTAFNTDGRGSGGILVETEGTRSFLVDAGPTLMSLAQRSGADCMSVDRLFLTHLHGDHVAGWPFLLLHQVILHHRTRPFDVYGPPGSRESLEGLARRCYAEVLERQRFEVRYQCGQALAAIVHRNDDLGVKPSVVFETTLRELAVSSRAWESRRLLDEEPDEHSPWLDDVIRARLHRSLEHVFTLLSLALDREPLELSLRALSSNDRTLRGTALEYLENVLPDDVRRKLWPYLGRGQPKSRTSRPRQQIVEDLLRSMDSLQIDREALMRGSDSGSDEG